MRPRTVLILFAVVAALAAFIWFVERDLPGSEERAELARRVARLDAEEVTALEIDWQGTAVRLEREREAGDDGDGEGAESWSAAEWRLVAPLEARADATAVGSLVDDLVGLEKERTLEEFDREELELAEPRGRVVLERGEGEPVTVEIGAELPAGASVVVALAEGEEAYVVSDAFLSELGREPGAWRDHDLFPWSRGQVERIALEGGADRVLLARRGEELWLEAPRVDRADREAVDELLRELVSLRAERFLDDPEQVAGDLGLEEPRGVVEVVVEGREEPFRIALGAELDEGEVAARAGAQLVTVGAELLEPLARPVEAWRSLALGTVETYQVEAFEVTDADGATRVEREGADWLRDGETIEYAPVSDFLYALTTAAGESLLDPAAAAERGVDAELPEVTITLEAGPAAADDDAQEPRRETIELFPALADGSVPARASGRDAFVLLAEGTAEEIRVRLAELRDAEVEGGEAGEVPGGEVGSGQEEDVEEEIASGDAGPDAPDDG